MARDKITRNIAQAVKLYLIFLGVVSLCWPITAKADGSAPIYNDVAGPFRVSVLGFPIPAQLSQPLQLSFFITAEKNQDRVTDAIIILDPSMPGMSMNTAKVRSRQGGTPNLYDIDVQPTMEGVWQFDIQITSLTYGSTSFTISNVKVETSSMGLYLTIIVVVAFPLFAAIIWFLLFRKKSPLDKGKGQL